MSFKNDFKAVKRNAKKMVKSPGYRAKFHVAHAYEELAINDNVAYFESYSCNNFSGNVFYIFQEVMNDTSLDYIQKVVGCRKKNKKKIWKFLKEKGLTKNVKLVQIHSKEYCETIETAHYIINNSTLPTYFIKRDGQIMFNTWHGTPLKTLGRSIQSSPYEIGNTQRNFLCSDFLLYPSNWMFEHMRKDYMLDNLYNGRYVIAGYPRNEIFYNTTRQAEIREELELQDMEVFMYMPTWRGSLATKNVANQQLTLEYFFMEIDQKLTNEQVMYVNPHNFVKDKLHFATKDTQKQHLPKFLKKKIQKGAYKHIRLFPDNYETYEFLSIGDCLITDYSSVFFDFANTGRKIILFGYDKESYFENRGVYLNFDMLPFPKPINVEQLIREMQKPTYQPYHEFIKTYCPNDKNSNARYIKDLLFHGESTLKKSKLKLINGSTYHNHKKNIMIASGPLTKNGIKTALFGLLNNIDKDKYNIYLVGQSVGWKKNVYQLQEVPEHINFIPLQGNKVVTKSESYKMAQYYRFRKTTPALKENVEKVFKREVARVFPNTHFDICIHFPGYERDFVHLFNAMDVSKRIIFVHNNMNKEQDTRGNFHLDSIHTAYRTFDSIAGVRATIKEELAEFDDAVDTSKFHVVHNLNNIDIIKANAELPIEFAPETTCTVELEELERVLNDTSCKKFITIGRYSEEKGHSRLLDAFKEHVKENPTDYLIIIGGHGDKYAEIKERVLTEEGLEHVILIKASRNPAPILKKCDYFILSSFYEGLPMVIMEALILNKPVICTDITGPREFLQQGYGLLVEDSTQGLIDGMAQANKGLSLKPFDAEAFNKQALAELYNLIED